jgi:D-glycero-D-manno-heptose 1,7-bisphosphate phosphatase
MKQLRRAVFLDRDGVINRAFVREGVPYPPVNLAELEILTGVKEALTHLHEAGYLLIVVTNQPDVARGTMKKATVENINNHLKNNLPIDDFRVCFHDDKDGCECRKPKPGALLDAASYHGIELSQSFMVGDRWRDTDAGRQAGCRIFFIDYGYSEKKPESFDYRVSSLFEATEIILGES